MPLHECKNCGRLSPLSPKCGKCKYGGDAEGRRPQNRRLDPFNIPPPVEYSNEYRAFVRHTLEDIRSGR